MTVPKHKHHANCAVITVSDTRTEDTDKSGALIKEFLIEADHKVMTYQIVQDDQVAIQEAIAKAIDDQSIHVVLLTGGTGIAKRDVTYEVVADMLEKELQGFGELFRFLSYQYDIGSRAMLSRAIAGTAKDSAIFSMPGSSGAVKLAMEKLILPELSHVIHELTK